MPLEKRYFDLIAADGAFLIGYDGSARVGPLSLRYRSLLSSSPAFARSRYALGHPALDFPATLTFGGAVVWNVTSASAPRLQVSSGPIEWRLDGVGFPVRAAVGGVVIAGRGYAETVKLKSPPWRLGVRSIRWGRFVGERSWAVWNIVDGIWPLSLFAVDGRIVDGPRISGSIVTGAVGAVEMGDVIHTVQDGDVVQSELSELAPLVRLLAGGVFALHQRKCVRRALLTNSAGDTEAGIAMDEFVEVV